MLTLPATWSRMSSSQRYLLVGEVASGGLLHGEPAVEALADAVGEGGELIGAAYGVAHD